MDNMCLKKLIEIKTSLELKKSELDVSKTKVQLDFKEEEKIAEGITNRCKEEDLLAIRQLVENLNSDDDNSLLSTSIQAITDEINKQIINQNK